MNLLPHPALRRWLRPVAACAINAIINRAQRSPYLHLPGYMHRYWLLRPRAWLPCSVRVHHILRSDTDRHLHDHPWANISLVLRGGYTEVLPVDQLQHPRLDQHPEDWLQAKARWAGSLVLRAARDRHRLLIEPGTSCWTLFIMFGKQRAWGFHTPEGWVWWRDYLGDYTTVTASDDDVRPAPRQNGGGQAQ